MNPVALYFASGESLYSGAALLLLTVVLSPFVKNRWLVLTRNVSAWISLAMIVMACPPFPWFVDLLFLAAFALWLILWNLAPRRAPRSVTASLLVALLIVLPALELGHRNLPTISGESSDHLVVIGDSISSGIDPRVPAWPAVMQEMSGLRVVNMARPGAYAQDGLKMADQVMPGDRLVLIEIGGNDLIVGVPASEFGRSLEGLLQKVARPGRTVVMFELPLLPWRISYGQIQRQLANKYAVFLIPKRYLTYVISGPRATSDGLHLLPEGTRRMATLVALILSPVMKPGPLAPRA